LKIPSKIALKSLGNASGLIWIGGTRQFQLWFILRVMNHIQKTLSKIQLFLARLKCLLQSHELQMLDGVDVYGIGRESESKPPKSQKSRKMAGQREDICIFCPPLLEKLFCS
jgi:hypothetical protein